MRNLHNRHFVVAVYLVIKILIVTILRILRLKKYDNINLILKDDKN
jgi:hypothetical protein